jgi:hypothetical protein
MATRPLAFSSALPFVSWSSATVATIPMDRWDLVYGSMQALKGHVQEYPGLQRFDAYVAIEPDEDVRVYCYTTWDTPEQLEAFLERGYTVERMLADVAGVQTEPTQLLEKIF